MRTVKTWVDTPHDGNAVWMTPHEAAEYLHVGVDTIYDACVDGRLKHTKLGYRTIRVKRAWIDEWVESHAEPRR
jgi:excisionase family DNA binding protein